MVLIYSHWCLETKVWKVKLVIVDYKSVFEIETYDYN